MSARLSTASLFAVAHWPAYGLRIGWLGLCIALLLSGCYARAAWAQPAPGVDPEKARELEILRSQINLLKATLEGQRKPRMRLGIACGRSILALPSARLP